MPSFLDRLTRENVHPDDRVLIQMMLDGEAESGPMVAATVPNVRSTSVWREARTP